MSNTPLEYYSLAILKEANENSKGVIVLSQVDDVIARFPWLKNKFYIVERRGWRGLNEANGADIKLVEDLSLWEKTLELFPNSICLDIGPADFVDTESFRPIEIPKHYDGIQISHWSDFKRPEILIRAAGLIPHRSFIKLGHFVDGGSHKEYELRDLSIQLAKKVGANICFPYADAVNNRSFPNTKEEMNVYINQSRLGILTTAVEGINRFKMECLSANIPVIVPSDTSYSTKKHIVAGTGEFFDPTPEELAKTIEEVLTNIDRYQPRDYIRQNTGKPISLRKLQYALKQLCKRDGLEYRFDDIDWDGRNQSLIWGEKVFETLRRYE